MSVNRPSAPAPKPVVATKPRPSTPAQSQVPATTTTAPTSSATAGATKVSAGAPKATPAAAPAAARTGATTPRTTSSSTPTSSTTTPVRVKTSTSTPTTTRPVKPGASKPSPTNPSPTNPSPTKPSPTKPGSSTPTPGKSKSPVPGAPAVPTNPPTRPVAGGETNARTNPTPTGTSAAELDAAIPPDQRAAIVAQQQQAEVVAAQARRDANKFGENPTEFERASLDNYYEQHPTYVDPATSTVYAANYDPATGDLVLTRNDEPATNVPQVPEEPVAPLSTRDDDYADDPEAPVGGGRRVPGSSDKPKDGAGTPTTPTGGGPVPSSDSEHPDAIEDADGTRHVGVDDKPDGNPAATPPGIGGPAPHVQDTVIVISDDGTRVTTVNTALATEPPAGKPDEATSTVRTQDASGRVTDSNTSTERTSVEDGGVVVQRTSTTVADGRTNTLWDDHRVDPNGDRTSRRTSRVAEGGRVVSDHRTSSASTAEVTINDSVYTTFSGGKPDDSVILRSAHVDGASRATRYEVGYDAEGFATTLTPPPAADANGREPLDAWVQQRLGPLGPDETHPAFGVVRDAGISDVDGTDVDGVVYVSELGVRTQVDGVDVFVEGDSIAASATLPRSVQTLRDAWQGMPPSLQGAAVTIDLLQGRSDGDRVNSARFESEFHAGASAGGDHMTYWLDNDPNVDTTRHEYGHLTGEGGGAPDETAWDTAMAADEASNIREDLAGTDPEDINFITSDQPLLSDELGVTGYAEKHLDENGNENDDWAESVAMYLSSREQGGVLQVRGDDGTVETYTFEELFPARAAILDAYYELGPAPVVAPPEFPVDDGGGSGGIFGGKGSGLGSLGGAIADAAGAGAGTTGGGEGPSTGVKAGAKLLGNDAPSG